MAESELQRRISDARASAYPTPVDRADYRTQGEYVAALEAQVKAFCDERRRRSDSFAAKLGRDTHFRKMCEAAVTPQ